MGGHFSFQFVQLLGTCGTVGVDDLQRDLGATHAVVGIANAKIRRLRATLAGLNDSRASKPWCPGLLQPFRVTEPYVLSKLELETLSLYLCADQAT
jgi:hypothetical protein